MHHEVVLIDLTLDPDEAEAAFKPSALVEERRIQLMDYDLDSWVLT